MGKKSECARYDPDLIRERLAGAPLVSKILVYQSVRSTNALAKRLLGANTDSGLLLLADEQTAGRGRFGRRWDSPPGVGLWFTLVLRPQQFAGEWSLLPLVVAEAVAVALRAQTSLDIRVKWPNDVLCNGKKICGILCESTTIDNRIETLIIGVGVNVNQAAGDFAAELKDRASSLAMLTSRTFDRVEILRAIIHQIAARLSPALSGRKKLRLQQWAGLCDQLGDRIRIRHASRTIDGILERITEQGELIVRDPSNRLHIISPVHATFSGSTP